MSDLISREAALEVLDEINAEVEDGYGFDYPKWRVHFRVLPSAQPERKTGEWREHIFDGIMGRRPRALMCTHCNVISMYASNFCPNCGAEMREASND